MNKRARSAVSTAFWFVASRQRASYSLSFLDIRDADADADRYLIYML
jgi:hypothetical protein